MVGLGTRAVAIAAMEDTMDFDEQQKAAEYESYAEHCLRIAAQIPDRESRVLQREMAAEWLKLAASRHAD